MNFYVDAWKKFATFGGRSRRKEFWFFLLINGAIGYLLGLITGSLGMAGMIIQAVFGLAILVPAIAVSIRRLHDIGKSGWWVFINCVPLIGSIWFIVLVAKDSVPGKNQWGNCPK
ncbi:MAG TPA: DUF805 domain-containing protein [Porphyromonadaceae bacterium]|nr:DUF805 domain-containing protein [Porphyromonadaceae bacterium]